MENDVVCFGDDALELDTLAGVPGVIVLGRTYVRMRDREMAGLAANRDPPASHQALTY
jgi:hypothetical protein